VYPNDDEVPYWNQTLMLLFGELYEPFKTATRVILTACSKVVTEVIHYYYFHCRLRCRE